jgi:hypothetical protein
MEPSVDRGRGRLSLVRSSTIRSLLLRPAAPLAGVQPTARGAIEPLTEPDCCFGERRKRVT